MQADVARVNEDAAKVKEDVIRWRRHLHQTPELSFKEVNTGKFVYDTLAGFDGLELSRPAGNSVMARLRGGKPGRVVAIRADMDALPITEDTGLDFASRNEGVMHACGHDGHTAMLLGVAKALAARKDELAGEVRFLFQHAEELLPGGAEEMVDAGVMEGVDAVIGTHLWSPLDCGKIGICHGPMLAAPDTFWITIKGAGGHASRPQDAIDSIAIGSQVVANLQHIVSRETDPLDSLVISVTQFNGGTADNVLPGEAVLCGTVRSYNPALRETVPATMERIVRGITQAHRADYAFKYLKGYRPVINHDKVNRVLESSASDLFGTDAIDYGQKNMGGEDFSAFQAKAPGAFFFVGCRNEAKQATYPHHHPRFAVDEDALQLGVKMFLHAAPRLLETDV